MSKTVPKTESKLEQERKILDGVVKRLKQRVWFADGWRCDVHPFPPSEPEVLTLHVFRANWMNGDNRGIHFETFLGPRELKKKEATLALHMFHHDYIPGTRIKPTKLSRPVIESSFNKITRWKGYTFKTGKYGTQPFKLVISLESSEFEEVMVKELERLCLELGPIIDETLARLLASDQS